jgi:hypothetical protein
VLKNADDGDENGDEGNGDGDDDDDDDDGDVCAYPCLPQCCVEEFLVSLEHHFSFRTRFFILFVNLSITPPQRSHS